MPALELINLHDTTEALTFTGAKMVVVRTVILAFVTDRLLKLAFVADTVVVEYVKVLLGVCPAIDVKKLIYIYGY